MRAEQIGQGEERTYVIIFHVGDEVINGLTVFAKRYDVSFARFTAIGAFCEATLAYFDWESKEYQPIHVREQVEVLSLIGDIADADGQPKVHAHVVVGRPDGMTLGGHIQEAKVRPTLEVVLTETPEQLRRVYDPETGLALIRLPRGRHGA
jgi:predicted DNA-binding protein with PD1-like motif